jgi:hypothetical protein
MASLTSSSGSTSSVHTNIGRAPGTIAHFQRWLISAKNMGSCHEYLFSFARRVKQLLFTYSTAALSLNKYSSCDQIKFDLGRTNNTHGRQKKCT